VLNEMIFTADSVDFAEYASEPHDKDKIVAPKAYRDETIALLSGGEMVSGARLPWLKTHDHIRFRPGEVSLWMGINGHGKSLLTSHVMLDFLHQNQKVCVASFEMKPRATLARMCKQAAGSSMPTARFVDGVLSHATNRLWLYDKMGQTDPNHLLAIMRYAAKKLGVQHFVIDSLMKVVKGEDDYNGISLTACVPLLWISTYTYTSFITVGNLEMRCKSPERWMPRAVEPSSIRWISALLCGETNAKSNRFRLAKRWMRVRLMRCWFATRTDMAIGRGG
jgi:hypothetical protein